MKNEKPARTSDVPPFWIRAEDTHGQPIDPRVRDAVQHLWPWAYRHVERELHDAASAAELLEEVAITVSIRLKVAPGVARNLSGYLITAFHRRVRLQLLRSNRLVYEGLVGELDQNYHLSNPDWTTLMEKELSVKFLLSCLPHPIRHMLHYRMLGFSWKEIGCILGIPAEKAKARFYYGVQKAYKVLARTAMERDNVMKCD